MLNSSRSGLVLKKLLTLEFASIAYIFLPCLLFITTYLRPSVAGIAWLVLLPALVLVIARIDPIRGKERFEQREQAADLSRYFRYVPHILVLGVIGYLILMSGMGGFAVQNADYVKHNAFLRDFVEYEWPVAYMRTGTTDKPGMVAYYLYYYLPAAAIGKLAGWTAANIATAIWGFLGVWLAVQWFLRLAGNAPVLFALVFLGFGGLDLIGWSLAHGWFTTGYLNLDSWLALLARKEDGLRGMWMAYGSNISLLFWAPHQVIAGWIVTGYVAWLFVKQRSVYGVFFIASALILWSPFSAVGLFPFMLIMTVRHMIANGRDATTILNKAREFATFPNAIAGPLLVALQLAFLKTNNSDYPKGFLWEFQDLTAAWPTLFLFYLVEFGLFFAFCPRLQSDHGRALKPWLWTSIALLSLIPFYRLGLANDFVMRASIPALFILIVCLTTGLREALTRNETVLVRILTLLLLIGAATGITHLAMAHRSSVSFSNTPEPAAILHINELQPKRIAAHYFGDPDSFFVKYLAAEVRYQDD